MLVPLGIYSSTFPLNYTRRFGTLFAKKAIGENKTTNAYLRYLVSFPYLLINLRTVLGEREISGLYSERDEREKGKSGINCCFLASGDNFMAGELNVLTAPKINGHQNGKRVEDSISEIKKDRLTDEDFGCDGRFVEVHCITGVFGSSGQLPCN